MATVMPIAQVAREELAGFQGRLIGPDDADYDEARRVYNAMIDKRPAVIARCATVEDVSQAVRFARDHGLPLAVRGGGHNGAGLGTCDDGVVVDLCLLKSIDVDPPARTVRVGGGATWGEVDRATHPFGLATPSGIISTTGVGGLTLGGGLGHLTRRHGLAIDNLLAADVVLASGEMVRASMRENPDLFWAIRGGGGNFGVVTSFLFRLHEVSTVVAGPTFWPVEQTAEVLSAYREFLPARAARPQRLLPRRRGAAGAAVPGGAPHAQGVRRRVVPRRLGGRGGRGDGAAARRAAGAAPARRPADALPGAPERVRRALPARRPVVLARGLRGRGPGRGAGDPRALRPRAADRAVDDAPLPDRRRGPRRRGRRDGVELPRRALGHGLRGRRSRPGRTSARSASGAPATRRRCTRTRPAART